MATQEYLDKITTANKPVLVDFYATWCPPCQLLLPRIDAISKKYGDDILVLKINVDEQREISEHFSIRSMPTLLFFNKGELTQKIVGLTSQENIEAELNRLLSSSAVEV